VLLLSGGAAARAAEAKQAPGSAAGLDPARCGGFSAADAAAILGVPAAGVARKVEQLHASLWSCSFTAAKGPPVVFSIEVARSPAEAAAQMERYRANLGDDYSDLMGLGDEGLWTEVNRTVTFRKQDVVVQVQQPPDKLAQLRVVKALFERR
jgi:hypothetical protein